MAIHQRDARMHKTKHTITRRAVCIRGQPLTLKITPTLWVLRLRHALRQQVLPYTHPCPFAALAATMWLLRLCTQQLQPCRPQPLPCIVAASPALHPTPNRCMRYRPARGTEKTGWPFCARAPHLVRNWAVSSSGDLPGSHDSGTPAVSLMSSSTLL